MIIIADDEIKKKVYANVNSKCRLQKHYPCCLIGAIKYETSKN